MIIADVGNVLLREVPNHLAAGLESGALNLFGSVIRDVSTGQIAGFLQEAAPLVNFIPNPALAVAELALSAGQLVQNEFVRKGLARVEEGIEGLSQLTTVGLGLSAAGIGVSVAGFAVLAHRISRVEKSVHGLADRVDLLATKIDQVRQDLIDADLAELKALAKALDEGWSLANAERAERQWHDVAKGALSQQARFESRAEHVLRDDRDFLLADPMFDAVAFANSLRVAALAACNESNAAHEAAADGAKTIERLTGNIGVVDLVRVSLSEAKVDVGTAAWDEAFLAAKEQAAPKVQQMRQREAAIATRTASLAALERQGISPRDWLAAARAEQEAPILLMLPQAAV